MIDGSCECGGAAMWILNFELAFGTPSSVLDGVVRVTSAFYPQLNTYYNARISALLHAKRGRTVFDR